MILLVEVFKFSLWINLQINFAILVDIDKNNTDSVHLKPNGWKKLIEKEKENYTRLKSSSDEYKELF